MKIKNWVAASWISIVWWLVGIIAVGLLLWFQLGTLVPGVSSNELATATAANSAQKIVDNPIGLPHKAIMYVTQRIDVSPFTIRLASTFMGLVTIGCFYYIMRNWYTTRVAVLSTLIFATSPWLLHTVRLGTDSSMYLLLFGAVAGTIWMQNSKGSFWSIAASVILIMTLLYIPGMVWFVIPALLWQFGRIGKILEGQNAALLTLISLGVLASLAPIGWAIFRRPELAKVYFGLPQTVPKIGEVLHNIAEVPVQLFFRGPNDPEIWLGTLSLLGIFSVIMFVIGLYAYFFMRQLDRTAFIIFVFLFGTVLIGIGGPVSISVLLPFMYLVVAGGIALMLQQWFTVFPRNPFARTTGVVLMTAVVLLAVYANLTHYFVAWPTSPETKQVFQEKLQ